MLKFGQRLCGARAGISLAAPGYANVVFFEPEVTREGTLAKGAPNSAGKWPKYVEGGEQTLRRKIKRVNRGDDQVAKDWLSNMTLAWLYPLLIAQRFSIRDRGMFREALKLAARRQSREADEEVYAIEQILPAIDLALPVQ
jgi:hypothetical protein